MLDGQTLRHSSPLVDARERVDDRLRSSPMETVVIRPTGFFNDMGAYLSMARRGCVWLIGDGATHINPIHGADLAEGVADRAAETSPEGDYDVGGPQTFTQQQIAELAFVALGDPVRVRHLPAGLLDLAAGLARPFNGNAAALLRMFANLGRRDAVGTRTGRAIRLRHQPHRSISFSRLPSRCLRTSAVGHVAS